MRQIKRSASLLLALLLLFALVPLAEAKTGTLVKNSGTRHTVCTALSGQAQAYYTGDNTYATVSALTASASDPMHSAMFNRLHSLMTDTWVSGKVSYSGSSNGLQVFWPKTDANNGSNDPMLFYSDAESNSYNREHVWPDSHGTFHQTNGGCDLHHLRPENSIVNSTRSSYTFGNVKNVSSLSGYKTYSYGGQTVLWYHATANRVEVKDDVKGDVARILLYVWCRWQEQNLYQDTSSSSGSDGVRVIESLETLLQWMKIDPVDTWEMSRNDQCENVQGNRNVFIDYPEYAWLLFEQTPPTDYRTPSGIAMSQVSYTVSAAANNAAYGSVSVTGYSVTATPNTGYYAESATVSPASAATVTRSGNVFTLTNVNANCAVTVNFAPKAQVTVSFAANGGTGSMQSETVYAGDAFVVPACGFTAPQDQQFAGWKWSADNSICQPGASVVITADCTFTAQWRALDSGKTYTLVTSEPSDWSGEYLIVYQDGSLAFNSSLGTLDDTNNGAAVTIDGTVIELSSDQNYAFTVASITGGYSIKAANGDYIGRDAAKNGIDADAGTVYVNTIKITNGKTEITGKGGYKLQFNKASDQMRFRYYGSSQQPISLYRLEAATVTYTIRFEANGGAGVMTAETVDAGESYTLPACAFTAPADKQFAGWTVGTDATLRQPGYAIENIGSDVTVTAHWEDATPTPVDAVNTYRLVTDVNDLNDGDRIILIGKKTNDAFALSSQGGNNRSAVSVSILADNVIRTAVATSSDEQAKAYELVLGKESSLFTLKDPLNNGYLYAASSSSNYLRTQSSLNDNGKFSFVIDQTTGAADLKAQGTNSRNLLQFNTNNVIFSCYSSGQTKVYLYKKAGLPDFKTQSLTLDDGLIGVNFYLDLSALTAAEKAASYMTFSIGGKGARTDTDLFDANCKNETGKLYGFTFYVNSIQMADTITATFHYTVDNAEKTAVKEYRVTDYFAGFDAMLQQNANAFSEPVQNLVRALADYGYYVQHFLQKENGWAFGASGYAETTKVYSTYTDYPSTDDLPQMQKTGSSSFPANKVTYSLVLDSATAINVFFTPDANYMPASTLTVTGADGATLSQVGSRWCVQIPNIKAQDLNRSFTITLKDGDDALATVTVSALCYVRSMLLEANKSGFNHKATATEWKNAATAIYRYQQCAAAYLASLNTGN